MIYFFNGVILFIAVYDVISNGHSFVIDEYMYIH